MAGARMHKIAISGTWAVAFTLAVAQPVSAQDCRLKLVKTIPIKMMARGGRPIVPVTLNGVEKPFLLDTGGAAA